MISRKASTGFRLSLALALLLATACQRAAPPAPPTVQAPKEDPVAVENGAISVAPVTPEPARPNKKDLRTATIDWSPVPLESGQAWLSCDLAYSRHGDGAPLPAIDRESLIAALELCTARGVLRLRYRGRIAADF